MCSHTSTECDHFERLVMSQPDCVSLIHAILSVHTPVSAWHFLGCCNYLHSMQLRVAVAGVRSTWTDNKWIYSSLDTTGKPTSNTTTAVVVIPTAVLMAPPSCGMSIRIGLNSHCALVQGTKLRIIRPGQPTVSYDPSGALVRCTCTSQRFATCDIDFNGISMSFNASLVANNNAMPHRDNNDFDRWIELHLNVLVGIGT